MILTVLAVVMIAASVFDAIIGAAEKAAFIGIAGWIGAAFFSAALLLIVWQLIQPDRFGVELNSSGFTISAMFGSARFRWDQIEEFGTAQIGAQTMAGFNYQGLPEYRGRGPRIKSRKRRSFGFDSFLPATLERRGEQLATFMEAWRQSR